MDHSIAREVNESQERSRVKAGRLRFALKKPMNWMSHPKQLTDQALALELERVFLQNDVVITQDGAL
jgi:hypothetical protein